jgi:excisionase family DNA binding protein
MKIAHPVSPSSGIPTQQDRAAARETSRLLAPLLKRPRPLRLHIDGACGHKDAATLPPMALRLLVDLLTEMAKGNAITLIPVHAELTTQEAANLLNVSRPHIVDLIKSKQLPGHKVGTHHRIRLSDLQSYMARLEAEHKQALDSLARQAQELDMGY